ncbi:hypothetical protein [Aureliella helgolandensis]|uniref:Uncharacterized protein n=1 Tax=Aureliella helgolandensis TaxID=2527968 RepID=A0A518G2Y7_9BACT|nr:hypothetical protein [Aureliella helgolandensis]QDV22930.1 hypothetical protein Q31a_12230 [Aureliella helgolandensis]
MAKKKAAAKAESNDDARLLAAYQARIRQLQGSPLRRQDIRDIEWLDARVRAEAIAAWRSAVPKGEYCQLAGRQHKLIDDAADNYRLPLRGASVNLREALTALHDLIAANSHRLRSELGDDRDELEAEKLRQQIVGLERDNERKLIDLQFSKGDAIPKAAVRSALVALAAKLRTLGQTLARIDPEARKALNDFLEALATEIEDGELSF